MQHGGCFCGAIRYQVVGEPSGSGLCHCRSCRKVASSTVLPYVTFPVAAYTVTQGAPVAFRSSAGITRCFCGQCGSPLTYARDATPDGIDIMTGSLDEPEAFPPTVHVWVGEKIGWEVIADDLPVFEAGAAGS